MSLVDTNWLEKNINKVKIIDCSWHMPQANRNGFEEYLKEHIPNAIFFDLDKNSKINTDLPHMLTDINSWGKIMGDMGIENKDKIEIHLEISIMETHFSLLELVLLFPPSSSIVGSLLFGGVMAFIVDVLSVRIVNVEAHLLKYFLTR